MRYHCVIFDLDGTLLNTLGDLTNAVNAALAPRGLPMQSVEQVRRAVGNGVAKLMRQVMPPDTSDIEAESALRDFKAYYSAHLNVETHPYPGVIDLLRALRERGVKLGVNSNKFDAAANALCDAHFGALLDKVVGESETVPKKPSPIGVSTLMKALNADPARTAYVGDSAVDIMTAKNAGLPMLWVSWGFRSREELGGLVPPLTFDDAEALTAYLLGN